MAFTRITNVAVKGVAACVPKRIEYNKDFKGLSEEQLQKYIETVGVVERHCYLQPPVSFRIDWDYPKKLWHLMSLWVVLVLSMVWA